MEVNVRYPVRTSVAVISAIAVGGFIADMEAQRRAPDQAQAKQGIQVSLNVATETFRSSDPGKCTYAPTASIYQTVSELWRVQQSGDGRSLAMSFWKPKDGSGDMVTLSVSSGSTSYEVNTVRGGRPTSGSGKVTFQKSGDGGTFTVDAKTKSGAAISGTIQCDTFAPHIAEGG
jgi:hypothetical protein